MLRSFHARLLAGFAIVIFITLFFSAVLVALLLRDQQAEAAEARIGLLVGPIAEGTRQRELLGWPVELIRTELNALANAYDLRILFIDPDQRVVIDTAPTQPLMGSLVEIGFTEAVDARGQLAAFRTQRVRLGGEDLYLFTAGESRQALPLGSMHRLVIAVPAGDVAGAWSRLLPRLATAGFGAGAVAVVFSILFASRITTPIREMTRASDAMAAGDLRQRIEVDGDDEVARLAEAFNLMSNRVSRGDRAMRDLLANVSHELRTPLTTIQGFSQAIADNVTDDPAEAAQLIHDEAERIRLLVEDLIYLSEIESRSVPLDFDEVDLDGMIEGTARRLQLQAAGRGVEIVTQTGAGTISADGRRIEQILANLVDNALRYAPPGSAVTIASMPVADGVLVEVHNFGPSIPPEDRTRVFDRFYQVDRARSPGRHRGLGLSIVQELVQAHGGHVSVESSPESGTTFSVFLPLVPHPITAASRPGAR